MSALLIQLQRDEETGVVTTKDFPVLVENFRMLFPNVSFPDRLTAEIVEPYGFGVYSYSQIPEFNAATQKVVESNPRKDSDGVWYQNWDIVELDEEEVLLVKNKALASVRAQRNMRLLACDWTQLPDAQLSDVAKENYRVYRQRLRDFINDADFNPYNFTWPTPPT